MSTGTFDPASPIAPKQVGFIRVLLILPKGYDPTEFESEILYELLTDTGERAGQPREGKLKEHLTAAQKTAISSFLGSIRTKIQSLIPA